MTLGLSAQLAGQWSRTLHRSALLLHARADRLSSVADRIDAVTGDHTALVTVEGMEDWATELRLDPTTVLLAGAIDRECGRLVTQADAA